MERVTMKFITDASDMSIQQISFDKGAPRYGALLGLTRWMLCLNNQAMSANFWIQATSNLS